MNAGTLAEITGLKDVISMKIVNISENEYSLTDINIKDIHRQKYCVFDLEATGPNENEDNITQIGAILIDSSGRIEKTFDTLIRPLKPIPEIIERLTGISNRDIEKAPMLSGIYEDFSHFCQDAILVTQAGYEYDWPLLVNECRRNALPMLTNQLLDTKALFTYLHPEINDIVSTNFLIKHYTIEDSDIRRHSAIGDCELIRRIFLELLKEYRINEIDEINIEKPIIIKKVKLQKLL
ncbi:3'-5' exonuclease [Paenibacillus sp. EZ-K15]|uniref:3'-5' exonuclease n=1 Tax=Paenibacillus sp. EZ-K15 TaxID=2044275 RepID=UPI0012903D29|nr:3'-5' exonuclease [Paenibacillus sp. EZ-K15]